MPALPEKLMPLLPRWLCHQARVQLARALFVRLGQVALESYFDDSRHAVTQAPALAQKHLVDACEHTLLDGVRTVLEQGRPGIAE